MAWRARLWPAGRLLHTPGLNCQICLCRFYHCKVLDVKELKGLTVSKNIITCYQFGSILLNNYII